MNSLEDAYINIAKEEEKLIANLEHTRKSDEAKGLDERSSLIQRHNIATINETINDTTDLEASRHYGTESNTVETDHFPIELERFVNSKTEPIFVR